MTLPSAIIAQDVDQQARSLLDAVALRAPRSADSGGESWRCTCRGSRRCSCVRMSCRTCRVALAVNAAIGRSGKLLAQAAQLAVFGTEFVSPLGNAVRFVDGEERDRHLLEPSTTYRRAPAARAKDRAAGKLRARASRITLRLLRRCVERAVEDRRRNSHLRELRGLVLHQRNQRRDDDRGALGNHRRQLVAERLAAAGRHDHAGVASGQKAAHDALLQRAERVVSPVAPQRREQVGFGGHERTV